MGKNIKNFSDFINEEISSDYLNKQINKARSVDNRYITRDYEQNLKNKHEILKDANILRKEKAESLERERRNEEIINIASILNKRLENKPFNMGNYGDVLVSVSPKDSVLSFGFFDSNGNTVLRIEYNSRRDNIEVFDIDKVTYIKTIISIQRVEPFFIELQKMFREFFPKSRYADRKVWSGLE